MPLTAEPADLPQEIDGFLIEARLGEGLAGPVFLARQRQPERRVILRILAGEGPDAEGRERLRHDIRQLTRSEHPQIARLFATGMWPSPEGEHPYLVMECIDGRPLTDWCARNALRLADRMALLAKVARAVHYMHTRGVLHGRLMSHNVLVDGGGQARILDFGVNAWLSGIGDGELPLDPARDLHALARIGAEIAGSPLPVALRAVLARAGAEASGQHYDSALEFALDLERWLEHRPVLARPASTLQTLGLFIARHRMLCTGGAIAALLLVGAFATVLQLGLGQRATLARAQARAQELSAANHFLASTLLATDRTPGPSRNSTVRTVLDQARAQLLQAQDMPDPVDVRIRALLGETYVTLGDLATGLPMQEEAAARALGSQEVDSVLRRQVVIALAKTLANAGQAKRATDLLKPMLRDAPGSDSESRLDWVRARVAMTEASMAGNDPAGAQHYNSEIGDQAETWFGPLSEPALNTRADGIMIAYLQAHYREALLAAQRLNETIARSLGPQHPVRANMLALAGMAAREMNNLPLARQLFLEAARVSEALYGAEAPRTLDNARRVAEIDHGLHRSESGPVAELRRVMEAEIRQFGPGGGETVAATVAYASAALDLPDPAIQADGQRRLQELVDAMNAAGPGGRNLWTLKAEFELARRMEETGNSERALAMYREVRLAASQSLGPQHQLVFRSATATAQLLEHLRLLGEARQEYADLLPRLREAYGERDPRTRQVAQRLAALGAGDGK